MPYHGDWLWFAIGVDFDEAPKILQRIKFGAIAAIDACRSFHLPRTLPQGKPYLTTKRSGNPLRKCTIFTACAALAACAMQAKATDFGQVMPLGDSITWGDAWTWTGGVFGSGTGVSTPIPGGYRDRLYSDLTTASNSLQFVGSLNSNPSAALTAAGQTANEGHPGYQLSNVAVCIDSIDPRTGNDGDWLTGVGARPAVFPNTILCLIGTNDMRAGNGPWGSVPNDYRQLISKIGTLRPGVHLYIGLLPPAPEANTPTENEFITDFNELLPQEVSRARALGYNVTLVDTHDIFLNPDGSTNTGLFFSDLIHPNQAGYNAIGDTWAKAMLGTATSPTAVQAAQVFDGSIPLVKQGTGWPYVVDTRTGGIIVHNGDLAALTGQIKSGFGHGDWGGDGVISSAAAADQTHLTGLGVISNDDGTGHPIINSFEGQAVGSSDVLIRYTYYGDADLNGKVDGTDYAKIDNGFAHNLSGWFNGDFNYDGVIDGSDYSLIDNAFNMQGSPFVASATAEVSSVPEPSMLMAGVACACLLRRRTR